MKIKFSYILVAVIIIMVIYRKRIGAWIDEQSAAGAGTGSASEKSPLQNLLTSTSAAQKTSDFISDMVSKVRDEANQISLQDLDLFSDSGNLNTGSARPSSFLETIRSQEDKVLNVPDPKIIEAMAAAGKTPSKRKREQSWWPDVLYDSNPDWNRFEGGRSCPCGCNGVKVLHYNYN